MLIPSDARKVVELTLADVVRVVEGIGLPILLQPTTGRASRADHDIAAVSSQTGYRFTELRANIFFIEC